MSAHDFSSIVSTSERVSWTVDAVLGASRPDLTRPFLPEALACVRGLTCLDAREQLVLNQIRGHSYAYLFFFIEASIIAAIKHELVAVRSGDIDQARALLRFVDEELKHQQLFLRFCELYRATSGHDCGLLESRATAEDVAATVMKNTTLAILLTILHIEWVSQRHYVEAVHSSDENLDPLFTGMLRAHWLEEAQHTKIDQLLLARLIAKAPPADLERAIDDYLELGKAIDGLLYMQMELDVASLERAIARPLAAADRDAILVTQATACRRALLWLGMTNPAFVEFLGTVSPGGAAKVAQAASLMAMA